MWLINVKDRKLECFHDERTLPPYAILSHTWTSSEATMQEYRDLVAGNSTRSEEIKSSEGYAKIDATCRQAHRDNLSYVWVDTCCIDKTSSAELTEAINSMFRWYQKAQTCYVHLADVKGSVFIGRQQLGRAKWFTRGWTLQELIAPLDMGFYDKNCTFLGTKVSLLGHLNVITGIDENVLSDCRIISLISVATRMSWAARRTTTKVEDIAYSLFGIFGVNLPLLYGEGTRAFQRLQEEILKETDDQSLFAWQVAHPDINCLPHQLSPVPLEDGVSVFAQSPDDFITTAHTFDFASPGEMSLAGGKGLKFELPLIKIANEKHYVGVLACTNSTGAFTGIVLQEMCPGHFMRHPTAPLVRVRQSDIRGSDSTSIYIRKAVSAIYPSKAYSYKAHKTRRVPVVWL
ncbi:hypothetical protein OPT61_g7938 [Boeremia exigua]|uniref:Uncharacterized protein n=1 Tax=Boeremia exigua TaxID=749465 RepID=A0ACC2I0N3_9PLEO|nr:hypothetical protein OPT61_g7938 [Boeremia exigua]